MAIFHLGTADKIWNPLTGSMTALVCMALVPEFVIVLVYLWVGFTIHLKGTVEETTISFSCRATCFASSWPWACWWRAPTRQPSSRRPPTRWWSRRSTSPRARCSARSTPRPWSRPASGCDQGHGVCVGGIGLAALSSGKHPGPGRQFRWDINDLLALAQQTKGNVPADTRASLDGPDPLQPRRDVPQQLGQPVPLRAEPTCADD